MVIFKLNPKLEFAIRRTISAVKAQEINPAYKSGTLEEFKKLED